MSRFLPPDHSQGDERTIGGYAAVHARPAAFDASDGMSYSVEILTERDGEGARRYGAFFLFMQWTRMGEPGVAAHVESDSLAWGPEREAAKAALGTWPIERVQALLEDLLRARRARPGEDGA